MTRVPLFSLLLIAASISGCAHSPTDLPEVPYEAAANGKEKTKLRQPVFAFGDESERRVPEVPYESTCVDRSTIEQDGIEVPMATFIWAPDPNSGQTLRKSVTHRGQTAPTDGVVHHYMMLPDGKMIRISHPLSAHDRCKFCLDYD